MKIINLQKNNKVFLNIVLSVAVFLCLYLISQQISIITASANNTTVNNNTIIEDNVLIPSYLPQPTDYKIGKKLTFTEAGASYTLENAIAISDESFDNLIKMIVLPTEDLKSQQKSALKDLKIKVAQKDNLDNYFEIIIDGTFDVGQSSGLSYVYAKAVGQSIFGGENNTKTDLRAPRAGNVKGFSFAGVNKNVLDINYNNLNTEINVTPLYGSYGETVRKFNKAYPSDSTVWSGFDVNSEVQITITAGEFMNNASQASIMLFESGGVELISQITAEIPAYGIEGEKYLLPKPKSFLISQGEVAFNGTYTVKDSQNNIVSTGNYTDGIVFDTILSGRYSIEYNVADFSKIFYLDVLSAEEASNYKLAFTEILSNYKNYPTITGISLPVYAIANSAIDIVGNSVKVSAVIKLNETTIATFDNVDSYSEITFIDKGTYILQFTATDYLGRSITSSEIEIDIVDTYIQFTGYNEIYNTAIFDTQSNFFNPLASDILIFDKEYGSNSESLEVEIEILKPDSSDFETFGESFIFDKIGEYIIRYNYSYENISGYIDRTLNVIEGITPVISQKNISNGLAEDIRYGQKESIKYLIAKLNTQISLPEVHVSNNQKLDSQITLKYKNTTNEYYDLTDKINDEGFKMSLDKAGIYTFIFEVENSESLKGRLVYIIEVREIWNIILIEEGDITGSTTDFLCKPYQVESYDSSTDKVEVMVRISQSGKLVGEYAFNEKLRIEKPGIYLVEYFSKDGISFDSVYYNVDIVDDTKPIIDLDNYSTKGKLNKFYSLANAIYTDNDVLKSTSVKVVFDGNEIAIKDGKFQIKNLGKYIVTYTAEDISGNINSFSYTIDVQAGFKVIYLVVFVIGALVVAGTVVVILKKSKRKSKTI